MIVSRAELERLLLEDAPFGDLTSETLTLGAAAGAMRFSARGPMIAALVEEAASLIEIAGGEVALACASGSALRAGDAILSARGPATSLLRAWKTAQTLIEIWSGVASGARAIVEAAQKGSPEIVVACTRKTAPGTRAFALAAVKAGGVIAHRAGLSETILVFPEHRAFLDAEPLSETTRRLRRAAPEKKLVIEVKTLEEALAAIDAGFDVIQTEKFAPQGVAEVARYAARRAPRPVVAAAGGVNAGNARDYAEAGADVLVTSAPYLAPPCDVAVAISRA
ncbi:ModD protein [Methylocystis bryophila]|uniref:Putative pyrophosphorylase ModD n=1 Tax=Methylocystis bryophila TaxID=655015 RepID=A0A1W6MR14_9HYPH|nr:ModD protein [Methylocystis bryophila]ARN80041.1 ModD protein [Methylocystis bryophila]BDV39956.1 ModD protein [Methylocystis bryophila]